MDEKLKDFLETYESKMKFIRKLYLKDVNNNDNSENDFILIGIFGILSIIFSAIILVILDFNIIGYVISLITLIILCLIYSYFVVKLMSYKSRYLYAVKKRGYKDIDEYENELSNYLTGPDAYYATILDELKAEHNITEKTKRIKDIYDVDYYIWMEKNILYVLPDDTEYRPEIKSYDLNNIRYYRVDLHNNYVVLKTSTDEYQFDMESANAIKELLPNKNFKNAKNYRPEDYINDYEIFMHNFKKEIENKNDNYRDYLINALILVVALIISFIILGVLSNTLSSFKIFVKIVSVVNLVVLFDRMKKLVRYRSLMYSINDVIYEINCDRDVLCHFYELKIALNINDDYDVVLSNKGYPYNVWVSNNYFHLFLDVAYYNVVYVVLGLKNDIKYKVRNGETVLKLKDKTFKFNKEASLVFDKLLNNKK